MLDKATRIKLRSLAMGIKSTIWIGKDGISPSIISEIDKELFDHELIKLTIQDNTDLLGESELKELTQKLGADVVTTIGRKVVLYKRSEKKNIKHVLA